MSLFGNKGKKDSALPCADTQDTSSDIREEKAAGDCCIKILGSDCKDCHSLYENAQEAVKAAGRDIELEFITDLRTIMEYGVMTMPALVINEQVVSMGKILKKEDLVKLLSRY